MEIKPVIRNAKIFMQCFNLKNRAFCEIRKNNNNNNNNCENYSTRRFIKILK